QSAPRDTSAPRVARRKAPPEEGRIARHAETKDPEHRAGEYVAGGSRLRREPFGIGRYRLLDDAEQVEQPDDEHEARVLEQRDERVDDAGNDELQRLRQHDESHLLRV